MSEVVNVVYNGLKYELPGAARGIVEAMLKARAIRVTILSAASEEMVDLEGLTVEELAEVAWKRKKIAEAAAVNDTRSVEILTERVSTLVQLGKDRLAAKASKAEEDAELAEDAPGETEPSPTGGEPEPEPAAQAEAETEAPAPVGTRAAAAAAVEAGIPLSDVPHEGEKVTKGDVDAYLATLGTAG